MGIEWGDLAVAFGLALALEGAVYALAPDTMRRLYAMMLTEPVPRLRLYGAAAVLVGLLIVWFIRGP